MSSSIETLVGVALIEKDLNNDLITWSFPGVSKDVDTVLKSRSGLEDEEVGQPYRFSRYGDHWQYILVSPVTSEEKNNKVISVALCILSKDFAPNKYRELLTIFSKLYQDGNRSPMPVMKAYLSVNTTGKLKCQHGEFVSASFDPRRELVVSVKPLFEAFGMEAVLIWVAMLTKKRVFVYGDKISSLMGAIRSFPLMGAWHRQNWTILRPFVRLTDLELKELDDLGVYVAGFTDPSCSTYTNKYDLFVDLTARTYQIAPHATADFMMTKYHKTAVEVMMNAARTEADQGVIKAIAGKTAELIKNAESLKTEHEDGSYITLQELSQRKMPPNMDKFLYNVAVAEGMTKK